MPCRLLLSIVALFVLFIAGCGKDSPTEPKIHADSFTLGTGLKGDTLTGETTVFHGNLVTIYWRVESSTQFRGADAEIQVDKLTEFGWEKIFGAVLKLIDPDDYVAISSYYHTYGTGRFRATGFIGVSRRQIGVMEFSVLEEEMKKQ
ncbi:MAG: hypothetical protein ACYC9O_20620 [Candidatus Latescibacterota bacterium]